MPTIESNDGSSVAFEVLGKSDRETILLMPGLASDRNIWLFQRYALAKNHQLILMDPRGTGRSDPIDHRISLFDMAEDVLAIIDACALEKVHFVGSSMAGLVGQILSVRFASRLSSLTLVSTSCTDHPWRRELLRHWATVARYEGIRAAAALATEWLVGTRTRRRFGPWLTLMTELVLKLDAASFIFQIEAILGQSASWAVALRSVDLPTHVIVGSQDMLTPVGDSEELHELLCSSKLTIVPGAGHGIMMEKWADLNDAILSFVGAVSFETESGRADGASS